MVTNVRLNLVCNHFLYIVSFPRDGISVYRYPKLNHAATHYLQPKD